MARDDLVSAAAVWECIGTERDCVSPTSMPIIILVFKHCYESRMETKVEHSETRRQFAQRQNLDALACTLHE